MGNGKGRNKKEEEVREGGRKEREGRLSPGLGKCKGGIDIRTCRAC